MEYNDFCNKIKNEVSKLVSENEKVEIHDVTKNNNVTFQGLTIINEGISISPTIYLNDFYEAYENGMQMEEIAKNIYDIHRANIISGTINLDFFKDYDLASKRIMYKLVNYDKNKELLKRVPHKKFLDLALVFYYLLDNEIENCATILIYNEHAKAWGVTANDLLEVAKVNTPGILKSEIRNLVEILKDLLKCKDEEMSEEEFDALDSNCGMYVLSNTSKINGAACIMYDDILKGFADEHHSDIYILPSSVHEGATRFAA